MNDAGQPPSAPTWAPLRSGTFRALWLVVLASNIGAWMQTVGAQWLLVESHQGSAMVAMVQTASLLPGLLLALPAGVLADFFDRRRLLIGVQSFLLATGMVLTTLTNAHLMPPGLLLSLTFAIGIGQTLTLPAWQALVPELVPRNEIISAAALGSINFNVSRAVGPAVAGLLIGQLGVGIVFWCDSVIFLCFLAVLLRWQPEPDSRPARTEPFLAALRTGVGYIRDCRPLSRMLLRLVLFIVPGSALWSLLPLIAKQQLGLGSDGYGALLGSLGGGAICTAVLLPRLRRWLLGSRLFLVPGAVFSLALVVICEVRYLPAVTAVLVLAGASWMLVLSSVNATMQLVLPRWVRARGLSVFQIIAAGGQAVGALIFGTLAEVTTLRDAHLIAATTMLIAAGTVRFWPALPIGSAEGSRPSPKDPHQRLSSLIV